MANRTIRHEIKLQPAVIVILGVLALGVCGIAFAPAFEIRDADAAGLDSGDFNMIQHHLMGIQSAIEGISACSN